MAFNFLKDVVAPAGRGDIETVKKWLKKEPKLLDYWTSHGRTMLWEAAYKGKLDMVKFLVDKGADIEALGCHYTPHLVEITPYCVAVKQNRTKVAEFLRESGAKLDIHTASYLGDLKRINQLLDKDPKLVKKTLTDADWDRQLKSYLRKNQPKSTPLKYALANCQVSAGKLLIDRGAEVTKHLSDLVKVVHWHEDPEMAKLILPYTKKGKVALDNTEKDFESVLKAFGEHKDIDEPDNGWPELVYICRGDRGGNPEEVKSLLAQGATVSIQNHKGKTALHCASRSGFIPAMKVLLEARADVNAQDHEGNTPLMDAIRSTIKRTERKLGAIELLIQSGAHLDIKNKKGETPLSVAKKSPKAKKEGILNLIEKT